MNPENTNVTAVHWAQAISVQCHRNAEELQARFDRLIEETRAKTEAANHIAAFVDRLPKRLKPTATTPERRRCNRK
jgi:hypothetical protein